VVSGFAALVLLATQAPKVTLTFFQEHFIVRDGVYNESAPLKLPSDEPKLSMLFRKNDTFAVWDERGLTIRVGSKVKSTRFPDIATSPKAFTRPEIQATQKEIRAGRRSRDVSGLSGAVRVGSKVFLLGRWVDRSHKTWSESLIQVDLADKFPKPKFLSRIHALSLADRPLDNQVFVMDNRLSYVARNGNVWGLQQFDPRNGRFTFDDLGESLVDYVPLPSLSSSLTNPVGLFVEKTPYGTTIAGRVDLHGRGRKTLAEARASMRFIDAYDPECVVLSFGKSAAIINTDTGAMYDLPVPSSTRRTNRGVVIWTPVEKPKRAWLFDPVRWEVRAWWNAELSRPPP
jgi:hypothetical protein